MTTPPYDPVHVRLADEDRQALRALAPSPRRGQYRVTYKTVICTAATPVQDLLPYDPSRVHAWIHAIDGPAVLCTSLAQAQDPANVAAGLPAPNGMIIHANTPPWPQEGENQMWVTAPGGPVRVSLAVVHRTD